ncbi:MAG: hypothetical protein PHO37_11010 [Kiritimatiellae bacterium]|nr:hypothetical protein [Kiritimatiellia bacterium]
MKTNTIALILTLLNASALYLNAAPIPGKSTYTIQELDNTGETSTTYGGLTKDGDILYYGNYDTVRRYDLAGATNSVYAATVHNADTKGLAKIGSTLYMAIDISYDAPLPSSIGTVDPTTGFTATFASGTAQGAVTYSIYDAAVYNGVYYFVANIGTINPDDQQWPYDTRIYRYNTADPSAPVEVANIGGYSGGIAFDTAGNLYYASQNWGQGILRFDAADVARGGLTAADGTTVADVTAGYLGFLPDGHLVATTGWGASLDLFDINTGAKRRTIAASPDWSESIGKFVVAGTTLYLTHTVWYPKEGALYAVKLVEPAGYAGWVADNFPAVYPGDDFDSDGDGFSNYAEFVAGTSPTNKADVLTMNIEMTEGEPTLSWTPDNIPGRSYTLQGRESLTAGSWGATNASARFFRVKIELSQ